MTVRETIHYIEQAVSHLYESREAAAVAREVVCRLCGYDFSQLVVHYDRQCEIADLEQVVCQLAAARPVQYVTGVAEFCDMDFEVCEGVLIPRPETAELVAQIISESRPGIRVLDVGTGSGAIAVALARGIERAEVVAVDISDTALQVAARNAAANGVEVEFRQFDALGDMSALGEFDVIVSNPPYIPQSDIVSMNRNVVDYEPHTALFVDDGDPLCFYRSIARNGRSMLREGGRLYFEIYEQFGAEVKTMIEQLGYCDVVVARDIFGKERMVWSRR